MPINRPRDAVDNYWGWTFTLVNEDEYCLKQMWMRAGSQSSLEFHVCKKETYIIAEGELIVGLRDGHDRGRNHSIRLYPGDIFHIRPGDMHCRVAVTDVLITEVSTRDDPEDTFIVEDGKISKYPYKDLIK